MRTVVFTLIGLAVLDGIVSHQGSAAALGGFWKSANSVLEKFLDPAVGIFGATAPATPTTTGSSAAAPSSIFS